MVRLPALLLIILLALPSAAHAAGLRCDGGLVDDGDLAVRVLAACGEPDLVDVFQFGFFPGRLGPEAEQWFYNFGPRKLLVIIDIRNGRVARIDNDGYGFRTPVRRRCRPNDIQLAMNKLQLLALCGEPIQSDRAVVFAQPRRGRIRRRGSVLIQRETLIYNFGNSRLLREVRLENGRVVAVDTERRGFE